MTPRVTRDAMVIAIVARGREALVGRLRHWGWYGALGTVSCSRNALKKNIRDLRRRVRDSGTLLGDTRDFHEEAWLPLGKLGLAVMVHGPDFRRALVKSVHREMSFSSPRST